MNTPLAIDWAVANQRHLMAALGVVRARLESHAARAGADASRPDPLPAAHQSLAEARAAMPGPPALDALCARFDLSAFERDLILLCAGPELDSSFASACAAAQGDPALRHPTFSLALAALADAHWSALSPSAPLRRWRLIECRNGDMLTSAALRIDERVLHFLAGIDCVDERLQGWVSAILPPATLPRAQCELVQQIGAVWRRADLDRGPQTMQFCGDAAGTRAVAAAACAAEGLRLLGIHAADLPSAVSDRETLARLWEREAALGGRALLIEIEPVDSTESARAVAAFVDAVNGVIMLSSREPVAALRRPALRFDVPKPTAGEQRTLWRRTLGRPARSLNGAIDRIVAQFDLGARGIESAGAEALGRRRPGAKALADELWESCRRHSRQRLDDLAQRIEPAAFWNDLVLPSSSVQQLREVALQVRQRATVYDTWGFAAKSARGLGIGALFAGASGTGKTLAAEVLANELRLDLYRIDLSAVVSKYIGETEKNLRRVFDAAEDGGAILLFDEADALFGKRSEVRDSHDRYANIEVSYLLQRMEAYRGLAILTTNMKDALDPAFLRRIRFVVQFPFPDATQRAEIWRRIFPAETPREGIDPPLLAKLNVAGGNIRNIALNAAFLAADADEPVRMAHLLRAARTECVKIEKPLTESEIGGWV